MSYRPNGDYNLDVLRGLVTGHSMISIRGHDETVPNGGPFGLSPQFGVGGYSFDQSVISATAAVVGVASTDNVADNVAGTGALTVQVSGLDASGVAQVETVTMTGQTAVNTVATFSAVFQIQVLTTGAGNKNAGNLYCGTGTFTAGIPAVRMLSMDVGFNISLSGYYVVPAGKTLYIRQIITTVATSNKDAEISAETSPDGILWYTQAPFGQKTGMFVSDVVALPGLPAGTHIKLTALGTAADTDCFAIMGGELVDD
jgi:hypothetical protein